MTERVAGVDPSLSSTGIAIVTRTAGAGSVPGRVFLTTSVVKVPAQVAPTPALAEVARVSEIVDDVCSSVAGCECVWIESLALGSRTGKFAERAHLYFSLLGALHARRHQVHTLTPGALKKQVTGNGNADKHAVINAVRDAWSDRGWVDGPVGGRSDRADAAGLAWLAARSRVWDTPPLVTEHVDHAA